jgi:hypothetical protein
MPDSTKARLSYMKAGARLADIDDTPVEVRHDLDVLQPHCSAGVCSTSSPPADKTWDVVPADKYVRTAQRASQPGRPIVVHLSRVLLAHRRR